MKDGETSWKFPFSPIYGQPVYVACSAAQAITVMKDYGPLIFTAVRVTADLESGDWIFERQVITDTDEGDVSSWEVMSRFNGQESIDFGDDNEPN